MLLEGAKGNNDLIAFWRCLCVSHSQQGRPSFSDTSKSRSQKSLALASSVVLRLLKPFVGEILFRQPDSRLLRSRLARFQVNRDSRVSSTWLGALIFLTEAKNAIELFCRKTKYHYNAKPFYGSNQYRWRAVAVSRRLKLVLKIAQSLLD